MMDKLLFLDVDGVLNNAALVRTEGHFALGCKQLCLLKTITAATCCEIVLSSSWRLYDEHLDALRAGFESHLVPHWIGQTPDLGFVRREAEILAWLRDYPDPATVVILDDDHEAQIATPLERFHRCLFVPTDFAHGLTLEHTEAILEFFKEDCK